MSAADRTRHGSSATPSGSRASSVAAATSQNGLAGPSQLTRNPALVLSPGSPSTTSREPPYQVGCSHLQELEAEQLETMLRRYAVGVRWGKKIRRGMVEPDDDDEQADEDDEQGQLYGENWGQRGYTNGADGTQKRRKLLPHPTCGHCFNTLHKPYVCLSCAYTACLNSPLPGTSATGVHEVHPSEGCISSHMTANAGHDLAVEIHSGQLYCCSCQAGIQDPRFELVYNREKNRRSGPGRTVPPKKLTMMPKDPVSSRVPRGIHNLGATCFLSVILQSFIHNPMLRNYWLGDRHNASLCGSAHGESCMACEMDRLYKDFFLHDLSGASTPPTPWTPSSFLYSVWRAQDGSELSQAGQQDSHELFISVLNALHSALTAPGKHPNSRKAEIPKWQNENERQGKVKEEPGVADGGRRGELRSEDDEDDEPLPEFASRLCDCIVHMTFSGVLQSDVRCLVCGYRSSTHDPVLDLSVDIRRTVDGGSSRSKGAAAQSAIDELNGSGAFDIDDHKKKKGSGLPSGGPGGKRDRDSTPMKKSLSKAGLSSNGTASPSSHRHGDQSGSDNSQDLLDCLRRYCTSERLPPSSYSCPQCGPVEASKQLSLRRIPPVLCIQLKRFEHHGLLGSFGSGGNGRGSGGAGGNKIEARVRFPMCLDVREFITPCVLEAEGRMSRGDGTGDYERYNGGAGSKNPPKETIAIDDFLYKLFCVIVHEGSLNTGHYWCFCKWKGQWYRLNDSEARPVSAQEVANERAYQLLYVRESLENIVCA